MLRPIACLLLLCFATASTACTDPEEFAFFEGALQSGVPECMADEFPMTPEFLSLRYRSGTAGVFLQTPPDIKSRNDLVYFELFEPENIGDSGTVAVGTAEDGEPLQARGKIAFFSSCTYGYEALDIYGNIHFDSFGLEKHSVITGRLEDAVAVEPRSGQVQIDDLSGSWHFIVRHGPPYEDFYALPERPEPGDF